MTTREHIINTADALIRDKGYNAFSFVDIAQVVGIKKPSVHHHFPRKTDLGIAVIELHIRSLENVKQECRGKQQPKNWIVFSPFIPTLNIRTRFA
ncbi:TetR/AcrR family transcriptional regulator [Niabella sp. W65]|nr:TetR/AcrR family transcriptional regulator [Niabella sp. W65]MCH7367102.1 TetR/AcrR family transcriptional regulator [Niabella sp. W65]ULT42776.1 TetR/AcrR family transcriptional regulator [Niabella sp. I65]